MTLHARTHSKTATKPDRSEAVRSTTGQNNLQREGNQVEQRLCQLRRLVLEFVNCGFYKLWLAQSVSLSGNSADIARPRSPTWN